MKAILHIPTGELVEFAKTNALGKQCATGIYITFRTKSLPMFTAALQDVPKNLVFRSQLLETDDIRLMLHTLCQHSKFIAEEFELVDIKENQCD